MLKKLALAALAGVAILSATPADAQYYDPYHRPPGYGYERPRYGYDRPYGGGRGRFGDTCVTSRGSCEVNPVPLGSRCRCFIEGFGPKRGNVF